MRLSENRVGTQIHGIYLSFSRAIWHTPFSDIPILHSKDRHLWHCCCRSSFRSPSHWRHCNSLGQSPLWRLGLGAEDVTISGFGRLAYKIYIYIVYVCFLFARWFMKILLEYTLDSSFAVKCTSENEKENRNEMCKSAWLNCKPDV